MLDFAIVTSANSTVHFATNGLLEFHLDFDKDNYLQTQYEEEVREAGSNSRERLNKAD